MRNFRQSLRYIWPYRWNIAVGVATAMGVSLLMTVSITMLIPVLQVITSREGLAGWVRRSSVEHRMGVRLPEPDDPTERNALRPIIQIRRSRATVKVLSDQSPAEQAGLRSLDEIVAVDGAPIRDVPHLVSLLAEAEGGRNISVTVRRTGGEQVTAAVTLPPLPWYRNWGNAIVARLPADELAAAATAAPDDRAHAAGVRSRLVTLAYILAALLAMTVARNLCRYVNELSIQTAGYRAMMDLRGDAYHSLISLPMSYFGRNGITDSISRLTQDAAQIHTGYTTLFGKTIQEPLIAVAGIAGALWLEWRVALVSMIAFPASYMVIRKFGKKMHKAAKRAMVSVAAQLRVLEETLFGLRVVKGYTMEGYERKRFFRHQRQLLKEQLRMRRFDAAVSPLIEVLGTTGLWLAVLVAAYFVLNKSLDFKVLITQLFLLGLVADAGRKLSNVNNRLQQADAAAERVFQLLSAEPESLNRGMPRVSPLAEEIRFENVTFTYPGGDVPVLDRVSLAAKAGTVTAIVGPNGSGKTTLLSLLPRFYDPQRGRISWDGRDILNVDLRSLRRQIGLVTQDAVLFADTIEANIRYGNKRASRDAVIAAARRAFADEFISQMPNGYDSIIGEHGTTLSGGQKQRIALARAMLRDPSVLVLDEAMSQVDADSEAKIQAALDDFLRGRTAFVIAHRFTTVRSAGQIVVMDRGRIVAVGTHQQLMHSCSLYQALYQTQFAPAETDAAHA